MGLPLMLRFAQVGFKVIGFDIDEKKIASLNSGQSYIKPIPKRNIQDALENGFEAMNDFSRTDEADALRECWTMFDKGFRPFSPPSEVTPLCNKGI